MGTEAMGRVVVTARIENIDDMALAHAGHLKPEEVRFLEIHDALVDTGATMLSIPHRLIEKIGLRKFRQRNILTAAGKAKADLYNAVRLTVQGRECTIDVCEVPDDCPVLIGQIPLEMLDFVVDLRGHKLIGNPEHGGEHIIEIY